MVLLTVAGVSFIGARRRRRRASTRAFPTTILSVSGAVQPSACARFEAGFIAWYA